MEINNKMDLTVRWKIYEQEKAKMAQKNLTSEEYTKEIIELCNRLEI